LLFVTLEASKICCSLALRRFQRDNWNSILGFTNTQLAQNAKNPKLSTDNLGFFLVVILDTKI